MKNIYKIAELTLQMYRVMYVHMYINNISLSFNI